MIKQESKDGLIRGYQSAGRDFLAYRLQRLFFQIKSPEDIALHNDTLDEVMVLIEHDPKSFFQWFADELLSRPKPKATLLRKMANYILVTTKLKG
jgi:hypothetical protein